jgi:6-hydroxy-3-succinoylpyridine 3-monooxygenase
MIAHFFMAAPATPTPPKKPRTIFYIDGLNVYYGAVRQTPALKWLNLARYCKLLRPNDDIMLIRYFSSLITGPTRVNQEVYLKALATTPIVEVILGRFKMKNVKCSVATCTAAGIKWFLMPEEKRTDVNLAVFMLDDAYRDLCDQFIVFSGDSDLVPAVNMVRLRFPHKKIIVYVPSQNPVRGAAVELRTSAHVNRTLPAQLLSKSQFPNTIPDGSGGILTRPATWK